MTSRDLSLTGGRVALALAILALSLPAQQTPPETPQTPAPTEPAASSSQDPEAPPVLTGDPMVKTALKSERRRFDVPAPTSIVPIERLQNARLLQDALREVPGVHVQRTSQGQSSPTIRGLTGYHTVLLLDGVRLNNSILRSGPNEYWGLVDPLSLGGAEVVTGPGSVLYGSDAVGGTLDARSLRRERYSDESQVNFRSFLRAASAEQSLIGRAEISGNIGNDLGFLVGGTYFDYGDVRRGGLDAQIDTGFDAHHLDAAIDVAIDEHWSVSLTARRSKLDEVPRTHRTVNSPIFRGTTAGSELQRDTTFERDIVILGLDGEDLDAFENLQFRLAYIGLDESLDRIRSDGRRDILGFDVATFALTAQATNDLEFGELVWGFDWYHDDVDSFRNEFNANGTFNRSRIQGPVADDATYDLLGVFANLSVPFGEQFELVAGGRLTYASLDAGRVENPVGGGVTSVDDSWFDASFSLRGIYSPTEDTRLWAGISKAFRAPNLSDVTRLSTARTNELEVFSPGLDPEDFYTFELGGRAEYEGFAIDLNYYLTVVDGLIIRQPTAQVIGGETVVVKRNAGDGIIQGIELATSYEFSQGWTAFGTFHWVDGQVETFPTSAPVTRDEPLDKLQPILGTFGVRYDDPDGVFRARAWAEGALKQDRLSTRDRADTSRVPPGGTPGWITFNIEGAWTINEHVEAFLAIENLFDEDYRRHGSGLQDPGFNVAGGVEFRF